MTRLTIGIVGCGVIAKDMLRVSPLVRQVKLVACCDVDEDRANRFGLQHRIPEVYSSYAQLLTEATLDCVYLAVPHNLHYEMILAALDAGKHVFVEKPITRTLQEANDVIKKISDKKVGVNYQYRYDRGCYALARGVQTGALGKVHSARINLPWHRDRDYFDQANWHRTLAQAGGGTLLTQGSHLLDVVLWALGERAISAMGYVASPGFDVEVETLTHAILETSGGTLISITSSMVAATEQPIRIEVYGERGTAIYRNKPLPTTKFIGVKHRKQRPPEWGVHALQRSLAGFANWVLEDKPYLIPAHEALPVLAAVDGIYRSAISGKKESIEPVN